MAPGRHQATDQPVSTRWVTLWPGLAATVEVLVELVEHHLVCLQLIHHGVPGQGGQVCHLVGFLGRVKQVPGRISVEMIIGYFQVHYPCVVVQHLAHSRDGVQPVGGVQAIVGGDGGGYVGNVRRCVARAGVEKLKLVGVCVPVELGCDSVGIPGDDLVELSR